MTNDTSRLYEVFTQQQDDLGELAKQQRELVEKLPLDQKVPPGEKTHLQKLADVIEKLASTRFRVLIVGRFNAGKTTFVNALLHGRIRLPVAPVPSTGVLCEIAYADEQSKRAILHPKSGMGPGETSEAFPVPIERLEDEMARYIKIDHRAEDQTSRYRKLELFWPLELCANGVVLIDSVGLDDPASRDAITLDESESADAVLFLMSSANVYTAQDKLTLTRLRASGHRSIIFVITRFDDVIAGAQLGEMSEQAFKEFVYEQLLPWTDLGREGIKFVDSRTALFGRMQGKDVTLSGIPDVEHYFQQFLLSHRGRAKLVTSKQVALAANLAVSEAIPMRVAMAKTSVTDLEQRYRAAQQPLANLQTQSDLLIARIDAEVADLKRSVEDTAYAFFGTLPDQVEHWSEAYEIQGSLGFPPTKAKIEVLVSEVCDHLSGRVESECGAWSEKNAAPMTQATLSSVRAMVEPQLKHFVKEVGELRMQIAFGKGIQEKVVEGSQPSGWSRAIGAGYGVLTGDFITGSMGALMGSRAMITTMAMQFAAGILLALAHLLNPFTIIIAVVASIFGGGYLNIFSLKSAIKKQVGKKFAEELRGRQRELAKQAADIVGENFSGIRNELKGFMGGQLDAVRADVEAARRTHQQGDAASRTEISRLESMQQRCAEIQARLDATSY